MSSPENILSSEDQAAIEEAAVAGYAREGTEAQDQYAPPIPLDLEEKLIGIIEGGIAKIAEKTGQSEVEVRDRFLQRMKLTIMNDIYKEN